MLRFSAVGVSDVGLVRATNQDSAVATSGLLVVADGVGGAAAGEVASARAASAVLETAQRTRGPLPVVVLRQAVESAQKAVALAITEDPARAGMATTLTAVLTNGTDAALAHLGDSRAYVWRDDELIQLTRDHTWTARAVDRGTISEDQVQAHPWRNVILRSVNGDEGTNADVLPLALRVGDRLLIASDGLTDLVGAAWLERLFAEHDDEALAQALLAAALGEGGRDNITLIVATVVPESAPEPPFLQVFGAVAGAAMSQSRA